MDRTHSRLHRKGAASRAHVGGTTKNVLNDLLVLLVKSALGLRYRVTVRGLDKIASRGKGKILFLPNHAALIGPVILLTVLYKDFAPHSLADEFRISHPLVRWLSRRFGANPIPSLENSGPEAVKGVKMALATAAEELQKGGNLLVYPAGRLKRTSREEIGAASAVETILRNVPDARLVLVRHNGLWGSSFSWATTGKAPRFWPNFRRGLGYLFLNGLFFMPRRAVEIEFVEPDLFPRRAERLVMNRFLEDFYNANTWPNTYVPYLFWEKRRTQERPEPEETGFEGDSAEVSENTSRRVISYLESMTGQEGLKKEHRLAYDLGLDSLALMEVILWLEQEFGVPETDPDSLRTVGDVMLAAEGRKVPPASAPIEALSSKWMWRSASNESLTVPDGSKITEVFLSQAGRDPDRVIVADPMSGEKTYRDIVTALMALKPHLEGLPGTYLGIMLPASVGAVVFYMAGLFAGKIPLMINFTTGARDRDYLLDLLEVQRVITSDALVARLEAQGTDMSRMRDRFLFAEDLGRKIGVFSRLEAYLRGRFNWSSLKRAKVADTAVILFTSGSESLPKAVPLSHKNILSNIRDLPSKVTLRENDVLMGILPPFHSFGLTGTLVLPLCMGMRTVYYPNPTEGATLARLIKGYRVSILVGTPSFLGAIGRVAGPDDLDTLRLAVSGAEPCPERLYALIEERRPGLKILEGYGATECSPIISLNQEDHPRPFTIGRIMPSLNYVLLDVETGKEVGTGQDGILLVRGPSVFEGYLNYDGQPPFVEFAGKRWYNTGDLVREDDRGTLTFSGRLKRFVKRGGEMISLPSIETVLQTHFPSERDDKPMIAVESTAGEESPALVLFTRKETDLTTVNRYIREAGLTPLHHIHRIIKLDEIPIMGTGKTDYRLLKNLLKKMDMPHVGHVP
jgi:acyl-CoA synthetase (AMP-forming)/AMP-acid ligase II/acyl carrier protein